MSYTQRLEWNGGSANCGGRSEFATTIQPAVQYQEYLGLLIEQKQQRTVVNVALSSSGSGGGGSSTGSTSSCCICRSTLDIMRRRKYCTWLVLLLLVQAVCIVNFVWDTHANYVGTHRIVDVGENGTANGTTWNATEPVELNFSMIEESDGGECVENFFRLYESFCRQTLLPGGGRSSWSDIGDLCPCIPPGLTGYAEMSSLSHLQSVVQAGGSWSPENCTARQRLAIVVPFRDREAHLTTFLQVLHPFLQRQLVEYTIFVVEQDLPRDIFNKASVMNSGFVEIESLSAANTTFDCYLFHDVDLLPLDDRNFYGCGARLPRHVGAFVDKWNYKLYYYRLFGGATSFRPDVFRIVNGFSNEFYGWGGEDDDMLNRIEAQNMTFIRFPRCVAKYNMIRHDTDKRNPYNKKRKIFIGGLSWDTTHASMLKYFSRYGEVIDCVVMKNPSTGKSRGFGFVTYKDPACVEIVLSSGPHFLDDRQIDPKACNPRSLNKGGKNLENSKKKIFIGGLPANITEAQLRDHFSKYGTVVDVVIMYDQQKERSRGFGFLTFESEETVDSVVKEHFIQINGKQVEVKKAEPRDLKMIAEGTTATFLVTPGFPGQLSLLQSPLGGSIAFPGQGMFSAGTVPGSPYPSLPVSAAWCSPAGQGLRLVSPNSPIMLIAPSGGRGPGPIGPGGLAYSGWAPPPCHSEMSAYSLNSSPASYDTPLQSPAYGSLVSSDLGHLYAVNNGAFGLMGTAGSLNELEKGSPAYQFAVGGYGLGLGNGLAGSLLSSGSYGSQSSEAVLPPGFFTTASPSLGYGRIPTNHASISPGFHPYRR